MMKLIFFIMSFAFLSLSCAVVPVQRAHSPYDRVCGISTHEYDLEVVQMGNISASCHSAECIVSIGVFAAAWTGITAVVSGSIVLIGNTVHWIEQQGPCDKNELAQQVTDVNTPLIEQGGKTVIIKEEID